MNIDSLLQPFQHFGIHLGLGRIDKLLAAMGNPHQNIPIIHVAGSNGKGSVCAYLSSILKTAGYRVGRYTSPHLIDWNERICLNDEAIDTEKLIEILKYIQGLIDILEEIPTQFEVITAAAWYYFWQSQVDIAVIEVGLGGRLDATNVCEYPLASVITSISREHWQNLGPTIPDITREKAGILKANCPAIIGILPQEAQEVVANRARELNCPTIWVKPGEKIAEHRARYEDVEYTLPLLGDVQLINSALAIATIKILQQKGWNISPLAIQTGIEATRWQGRIQWITWRNHRLLIDGSHNSASSQVLRNYVDTLKQPILWIMGILATKDHEDIFKVLLNSRDQLYLVPVPDHSTAEPEYLADLAHQVCPQLETIKTFPDLFTALETALENNDPQDSVIVLCGSLYLVGYFLQRAPSSKDLGDRKMPL